MCLKCGSSETECEERWTLLRRASYGAGVILSVPSIEGFFHRLDTFGTNKWLLRIFMETRQLSSHIQSLKKEVAGKYGLPLATSADFKRLSSAMMEAGAGYLSQSTLKRLWGYVKDTQAKHLTTLDILARYVGCDDFHSFCKDRYPGDSPESGFTSGDTLGVESISQGETVALSWAPNREMTLRYLGEMTFEIVESANTRLAPGTRVRCLRFVADEPLLLDLVSDHHGESMVYIVGKHGGIRWSRPGC